MTLQDLFAKGAAHNEGTSKTMGLDQGVTVQVVEDKGENEDVMDDA